MVPKKAAPEEIPAQSHNSQHSDSPEPEPLVALLYCLNYFSLFLDNSGLNKRMLDCAALFYLNLALLNAVNFWINENYFCILSKLKLAN